MTPSTPQTKGTTRKGFRPHPYTLTLAHALYPTAGTHTTLIHTLITESLLLKPGLRPSSQDLALLHEKVLHLENTHAQKTLTSKGAATHGASLGNRYPTISLYFTDSQMADLSTYMDLFPEFGTLNLMFKHALFTMILYRGISFQEVTHHFNTPRLATAARRIRQGYSNDPFITQRNAGLLAQRLPSPHTGELPQEPTLTADNPICPSSDEIVSTLEELLVPPLVVPTEAQLTNLRRHLIKGQSHAIFPHTDWDYTPILEKALTIGQNRLSQDILSIFNQ